MMSQSAPACRELNAIDLQIQNSPCGSAKFDIYPKNEMVSQYLSSSQSLHDDNFYSASSSLNNNNNSNIINNNNSNNSIDNNSPNINNISDNSSSKDSNHGSFLRNLGPASEQQIPHPSETTTNRCACPVMACSHVGDPNQATPLLIGVKVINEWPCRNGNTINSNNNNNSNRPNNNNNNNSNRPNTVLCRRNDHGSCIIATDDKLDAYNLNGSVVLNVPSSGLANNDFPPEKFKTFLALLILLLSFFFTTISLAIVHDRVPDRAIYKPLPDTFLDLVAPRDWALSVSEIFIMITTNITLLIVVLHKHRYIVFRRMFLMLSLLYFMRSITMFVTVLPVSSRSYECSEKVEHPTIGLILVRALQLCSGLGLTINGKHTYCGDYIYSGHTTILVMGYLTICEYSPRRYYLLHWLAWIMAFVGVIMVLVSHGHYTLDVIIAYYVTTRLFWLYHTLASNLFLKQRHPTNYFSREWWFRFFQYFEGNVKGPVPLEYNFPISWPLFGSRRYHCND